MFDSFSGDTTGKLFLRTDLGVGINLFSFPAFDFPEYDEPSNAFLSANIPANKILATGFLLFNGRVFIG